MGYDIPLFDLNYDQAELDAVTATLKSKWISTGPNVAAFEKAFAGHLGVEQTIAVSSCTAALHMAMLLAGIGPGDEVIVPSLTFVATVNAVRYAGGTPVFADITSLDDFSIDPADVERKISGRTKAVVAMHYAGFSCDMDRIMAITRKHGLKLIEDAAHAPGSAYGGRPLGSLGDFGCFSFFSNKNMSCAEGGLLVAADPENAARARLLRSHGMTTLSFDRGRGHATTYDVVELGYNYRLDDIRASLLRVQFEKLVGDIGTRVALRAYYEKKLSDIADIVIPYSNTQHRSSHYIFPVVLKDGTSVERDRIRRRLAEDGIETSVHYPAVHRFAIYQDPACKLPLTEYVADNAFTLPLYSRLTEFLIDRIADSLHSALA